MWHIGMAILRKEVALCFGADMVSASMPYRHIYCSTSSPDRLSSTVYHKSPWWSLAFNLVDFGSRIFVVFVCFLCCRVTACTRIVGRRCDALYCFCDVVSDVRSPSLYSARTTHVHCPLVGCSSLVIIVDCGLQIGYQVHFEQRRFVYLLKVHEYVRFCPYKMSHWDITVPVGNRENRGIPVSFCHPMRHKKANQHGRPQAWTRGHGHLPPPRWKCRKVFLYISSYSKRFGRRIIYVSKPVVGPHRTPCLHPAGELSCPALEENPAGAHANQHIHKHKISECKVCAVSS